MADIDQFPLEAEIALSELRSEVTLTERLSIHHRLRVRRRNELIGVLIDAEAWHQLVRYVQSLEAEVDRAEDAAVRALVEARLPEAAFESGSLKAFDEIELEYQRIISENPRSHG